MKWLNKLERSIGKYAIPNLMLYIVGLNAIAYGLIYIYPGIYEKLVLIPQLVYKGEIWRLFTFIAIPPSMGLLGLLVLYFYYTIGSSLEHEWGTTRFNIYYFLGILSTVVISLLFGIPATPVYINLSLFLAFAKVYPNYEILIFYILPVKVKYLAWLDWIFFAFTILTGSIPEKIIAIIALINYFIFFGKGILSDAKTNRKVQQNRQRYRKELPKDFTYHRCTVCGKTEKDDPKLEFRYCNECEGDYEYCMEHIRNHEHKKKPSNVIEFKAKQE